MGNNINHHNDNVTVNSNIPESDITNVRFFTKANFQGIAYDINHGNYIGRIFHEATSPNNIFSLIIPPHTTVRLFCGETYDYGEKGSMHITNVTDKIVRIPTLPDNIQGNIKSISITNVTNTQNDISLADSNISTSPDLMNLNSKSVETMENYYEDTSISYDIILLLVLMILFSFLIIIINPVYP